jgi:hypothetical protein
MVEQKTSDTFPHPPFVVTRVVTRFKNLGLFGTTPDGSFFSEHFGRATPYDSRRLGTFADDYARTSYESIALPLS